MAFVRKACRDDLITYAQNNRNSSKRPDNHRPLWFVLLQKYGLSGTLQVLWSDVLFDLVNGTDTAAPAGVNGLDLIDRGPDYNRYVPSTFRVVRDCLMHLETLVPEFDYRSCDFLDYGSGKAKALIAASDYPFRRLTGIEIDLGLCSIAQANLQKLKLDSRVCCKNADAAQFKPSSDHRLVYFFNPFTGETLQRCLQALTADGISRYVIYINPTEDSVFVRYLDKLDEVTFLPGRIEVNFYTTQAIRSSR